MARGCTEKEKITKAAKATQVEGAMEDFSFSAIFAVFEKRRPDVR